MVLGVPALSPGDGGAIPRGELAIQMLGTSTGSSGQHSAFTLGNPNPCLTPRAVVGDIIKQLRVPA